MKQRQSLAVMLAGGDRRSIGDADRVAGILLDDPRRVIEAIALLAADDPLIAMRAADALEKASMRAPAILDPHRGAVLGLLQGAEQQEVVWHLAQMMPRLALTAREARKVAAWLADVFERHESRIARACALEALCDLAAHHEALRPTAAAALKAAASSGVPSLAARARRLAKRKPGPDR